MELEATSEMPIGKYKGVTIERIVNNNPEYLFWFYNNVEQYTLEASLINQLKRIEKNGGFEPIDNYNMTDSYSPDY